MSTPQDPLTKETLADHEREVRAMGHPSYRAFVTLMRDNRTARMRRLRLLGAPQVLLDNEHALIDQANARLAQIDALEREAREDTQEEAR